MLTVRKLPPRLFFPQNPLLYWGDAASKEIAEEKLGNTWNSNGFGEATDSFCCQPSFFIFIFINKVPQLTHVVFIKYLIYGCLIWFSRPPGQVGPEDEPYGYFYVTAYDTALRCWHVKWNLSPGEGQGPDPRQVSWPQQRSCSWASAISEKDRQLTPFPSSTERKLGKLLFTDGIGVIQNRHSSRQ